MAGDVSTLGGIRGILQRMKELTYPKDKFEVIVIDDASTDRTGEKAERFAFQNWLRRLPRNKH